MFFRHIPEIKDREICQAVQASLKTCLGQSLPCLACSPSSESVRAIVGHIRDRFRNVIVLGTGGSGLGGRVLSGLSQDSCAPRLIFLDEIHPETFYASVLACSPEDTAIITISKSGETAETLCQLLAIFQHFLPPQQAAHFFVLTEDRDSPLQTIAKTYGFTCFALPRDIGGRFSVLSLTGLFPALIAGVDETLLLKGARHLLRSAMEREPSLVRSLVFAAHAAQNKRHQVLLSYDVRFAPLALWQRQLWAESLGKNRKGTTPITAQGTIDQHSQLQLYLDGARDKVFTFLSVQQEDTRLLFDVTNVEARLKYLKRRTMGDLLAAECQATYDALRTKTLPVRHFAIEAFDPASIGALLAYFMCEVIVVGTILGVNPFDQPAVEHIKVRTREILS